jgi:hypothetical protein
MLALQKASDRVSRRNRVRSESFSYAGDSPAADPIGKDHGRSTVTVL